MTAPSSPFRGLIDSYEDGVARGWALDLRRKSVLHLHVLIDGQEIAVIETGLARPDLASVVKDPDPRIGFAFQVPEIFLDGHSHRLSFRFPDRNVVPVGSYDDQKGLEEDIEIGVSNADLISGYLEGIRNGKLHGWVLVRDAEGRSRGGATVSISIDGKPVTRIKADGFRGDVGETLKADGLCGFAFPVPAQYQDGNPHLYAVTVEPDGVPLANSPVRTSIADDRLQAELMEMTETIDRLHRDLSALRRRVRDIMPHPGHNLADFDRWARLYYSLLRAQVDRQRLEQPLTRHPLVTVLCPVYKPIVTDFVQAVQSVLSQTYENWELVFIDDGEADATISEMIETYCASDERMRNVPLRSNVGIAGATNAGLAEARGDYIVFFDHDDALVDVALEVMIRAALETDAQLLYSDEDKIDAHGRFRDPNLKPDFDYRYLLGCNYICHLTMMRSDLIKKIGDLRSIYDGAQDHDYILRAVEVLDPSNIFHVREILYHWRITENSTAARIDNKAYAVTAGVRAVTDHLKRRGLNSRPRSIDNLSIYDVNWQYRSRPRVTVIIPFRDEIAMTRHCVETLLKITSWPALDLILVDNWSTTRDAAAFTRDMSALPDVTVLRVEEDFNFSRLNNFAVRHSDAEFVVFMNNDVIVENADWLRLMVNECLANPDIAAVGNLLLYEDETVQHAGVVVGPDVIGAHAHRRLNRHDKGYIGRIALTHEVSAVTAACMLVRRKTFISVGGFDEDNLKIAYNDVDLCLKLRQAGFKILYVAASIAHHLESRSRGTDDRPEHEARFFLETQFMREKWQNVPDFQCDPFYARYFRTDAEPFLDLRSPEDVFKKRSR